MQAEWVGGAEVALTSGCPCGVTHRLSYRPPAATSVLSCPTGTVLAVGPDAWSRAREGGDGILQIAYAPRSERALVRIAVLLPPSAASYVPGHTSGSLR